MSINEQRFLPSVAVATSLLGLVPSVLCSRDVDLKAAITKYRDDLPLPEFSIPNGASAVESHQWESELRRWKAISGIGTEASFPHFDNKGM